MIPLIKLFLDICLLRRGPQDVPASSVLFALVLLASLTIDVTSIISQTAFADAMLVVFANTATNIAVIYVLLRVLGHVSRFQQTLIALLGTGLILSCMLLPMLAVNIYFESDSSIFKFFLLGFHFWSLIIITHILRHALEINIFPASVLAIGYVMLSFSVVNLLLPQAG